MPVSQFACQDCSQNSDCPEIQAAETNLRKCSLKSNYYCRSLDIIDTPPIFMQLASSNLLSLNCSPEDEEHLEMPQETVSAICNLTALTRLALYDWACISGFSALQGLNLRELRLGNCSEAAQQILATGQMTSLERLHIADWTKGSTDDVEAFNSALTDTSSPDHTEAVELHQLGQAILSLPRLAEVSGPCRLFSCAMAEELRAWPKWLKEDPASPAYQAWKRPD